MHSLKFLPLAVLAFACLLVAQTAPSRQPAATPKAKSAPASAPQDTSEPVITLDNLCIHPKPKAACKTVVTRTEFERLVAAVRPNLPPSGRMQLAQRYVELLTFADKALQAGLDKTPEFQQQLQLMRMQALAGAYSRYLQEKFAKAPDTEVEKYYRDNLPAYEEVTLRRIYIPKPPSGSEKKPALDEAATRAMAEKLQARAAAGEDFDKLQEEAFVAANPEAPRTGASPTTLGPRRRGQLPAPQESVIFALEPGKASRLLEESSGFFIYKVEKKQVLPLSEVKGQIERQLEEQKLRDAIQQTIGSVKATYNDSYFKPAESEPKTAAPSPKAPELNPGAAKPNSPPPASAAQPK